MKLFHVTTIPATLGFLRGQSSFMRAQGFEVHAISSPGAELEAFGELERVLIHAIPMTRSISPLRDLKALGHLIALFRRQSPELVHAHTPKAGLIAMLAAWIARVPCRIFHIHGHPHSTVIGFSRTILKWSTKVACALATRVLCVSRSASEIAIAEGLCKSRKLRIPAKGTVNGVDASFTFFRREESGARTRVGGLADDAIVIGFAGRLVRDKGISELHQGWTRIRAEFPSAYLAIAGEAEERDALPDHILESLRSDDRVLMLGWQTDMPGFYQSLDVLALPSYREGFPTVILEAAAMEVPVIATRTTGCVDAVLDGVTGLLVNPGDSEDLTLALRTYILNRELRARHGRQARARVLKDFRPADVWNATLEEYKAALCLNPGRRQHRIDAHQRAESDQKSTRRFGRHMGTMFIKRVIDIVVSLFALVTFSPMLILVALLVRFQLGSPILFRQRRPGLREQPFEILKFRTMRHLQNGEHHMLSDAQRLTPLGGLLRRTSLDELPELWNVLKGNMSLVGPRPLLYQYVGFFTAEERQRALVRPGITGWAQVHGRNHCAWDERLARDAWYANNVSLWLDLRILAMTFVQVLRARDVAPDAHAIMRNLDEERAPRTAG